MGELISKHSIKIQLTMLCTVLAFVVYWAFTASAYVFKVDDNCDRIEKIEIRFETLATKGDLKTLKEDIKDFIIK